MKHELEPIGRSLIFSPCCKATALGLEWLREPTDDEILADDYTVQRCDDSAGWWKGDVIVKRWQREARVVDEATGEKETLRAYAIRYAHERGTNEDTERCRADVSAFYPVGERSPKPITWSHHYLAWKLAGGKGLSVVLDWLAQAKANGWSTGQLRQAIGRAHRNELEPPEPDAPTGDLDEAVGFNGWAQARLSKVNEITPSRAAEYLLRLNSVEKFIAALRARVAAARDGGKESFSHRLAQR